MFNYLLKHQRSIQIVINDVIHQINEYDICDIVCCTLFGIIALAVGTWKAGHN
jgi:hypothetical protein